MSNKRTKRDLCSGSTVSIILPDDRIVSGTLLEIVTATANEVSFVRSSSRYRDKTVRLGDKLYIIDFGEGAVNIYPTYEVFLKPVQAREYLRRRKVPVNLRAG